MTIFAAFIPAIPVFGNTTESKYLPTHPTPADLFRAGGPLFLKISLQAKAAFYKKAVDAKIRKSYTMSNTNTYFVCATEKEKVSAY